MNMIPYSFQDCLASEVNSLPIVKGTLIFCRDSGDCYYDTPENERIHVSKTVVILGADSERTGIEFPDSDVLYVVRATKKIWIYSAGWICLNPDTKSNFTSEYIEVNAGGNVTISDSRIMSTNTAKFIPIPAITDLYTKTMTYVVSNGSCKVTNPNSYKMIGYVLFS